MKNSAKSPFNFRFLGTADIPRMVELDEENNLWDGWNEKKFFNRFEAKNTVIGGVEVNGQLAAFVIYDVLSHDLEVMRLEITTEYPAEKTIGCIIKSLKRKCRDYGKKLRLYLKEEKNDVEKYKILAKHGFGSRLEKNFFENGEDAYVFEWETK